MKGDAKKRNTSQGGRSFTEHRRLVDERKRRYYDEKMQLYSGDIELRSETDPMKRRAIVDARERDYLLNKFRDKFSNFPEELIHCIIQRLPVHDAARTSVLSKAWKKIWIMHPTLVLDNLFFSRLISKRQEDTHLSAFSRAVEMILLVHTGPILDFSLYIPPKLHQCPLDLWIKHLSNKGVRHLKLVISEKKAHEVPSYLFDCAQLTHLKLTNWILNPVYKSGSFSKLIYVSLNDVSITADMSFGTQLQELCLYSCNGVEHLNCQFTNSNDLRRLTLHNSEKVELRWFECTKKLESVSIAANSSLSKSVILKKLLSNVPGLHSLLLSGFIFKDVEPNPYSLERLTTTMVNLRRLELHYAGYNLYQISTSLYLIKNLSNLQELSIVLGLKVKSLNAIESKVERALESLVSKGVCLHRLLAVKVCGVVGSRSVLQLIKILLAFSPLLRVISLSWSSELRDPLEMLRIEEELQLFPRLSSVAQLIWF